jgi:hypothetical protein
MPELTPNEKLVANALEIIADDAKSANLLFVAHGAGLAGCISLMKSQPPYYPGIGLVINLFAFGFIFACVAAFMLAVARSSFLMERILNGRPEAKRPVLIATGCLLGSFTLLIAAVLFIAVRSISL